MYKVLRGEGSIFVRTDQWAELLALCKCYGRSGMSDKPLPPSPLPPFYEIVDGMGFTTEKSCVKSTSVCVLMAFSPLPIPVEPGKVPK